ncbi:uncharacterized protein [Henckelia pumila]|uniref:uncharacterized protein n=1 Tax=Henckelia pumila TaxID=405737 RepID=UPI003C6EA078
MKHFYSYCCLIFSLAALVAGLEGTNSRRELQQESPYCYKVLPEIQCTVANVTVECEPKCKKLCGKNSFARCVLAYVGAPSHCACEFRSPDCSKFYAIFKIWMLIYKRRFPRTRKVRASDEKYSAHTLKNSRKILKNYEARLVMDTPYTSSIRSPILDGTNYGPWKLKMSMYIQSIESRAWQRVLDGWTPPMRDDDVPGPKPRSQWTADVNTSVIYNAKALNAMDAWEKLQTHCEGSASVKKTRMRLITSKFEKMRMEESETIMKYNGRLKSLANEASILGDPISNERLVSKVLRSVSKKFHTKVCAIDESKDTSIMGLDELISSLRTYEMELEAEDDSKGKFIAFQEVKDSDLEENSIALISKKFTDYLKVMKEKKDVKSAQPSKFPRLPTSEKPQKPAARGPRQRECKGYGHYAYECANHLRKGMNVSPSDDDSEEEQEEVEHAYLISFTALLESKKNFQINPLGVGFGVATPGRNTVQKSVCFVSSNLDNSSNHEEQVADPYTLEGIQKLYEELYSDWNKRSQLNTTLTKENTELKAAVARLEILMSKKDLELGLLNSELERAKTTLDKFNSMFVKEGNDSLNHPSTASKGLKDHLMDYLEQNGGRVTYGGGAKGRIVGKGTLNVEGFPKLHNVLHVQDQLITATNSVKN